MLPKKLQERIDEKFELIQKQRPMSASMVARLKEQFAMEMTFNSNAIEGNKLTLKETYLVVKDGLTVKGKSLKDHLEAKNHNEAIQFLYDLVEHGKKHSFSEQLVRELQQLVVKDTDTKTAGAYRTGTVMITGSKHEPPEAIEVPRLMRELILWIRDHSKAHPVELAALAHHKLVSIHPFFDGNGRTARLFMNVLLMQRGYPMVVILKNDRKKYYRALELADSGEEAAIVKFVAQAVERSMNLYLKAFSRGTRSGLRLVPLSALTKKSHFSEKYLNLLARSGKLEAHKEGRIWVSSEEALKNYMDGRERKRGRT
jgi:Fic family protein